MEHDNCEFFENLPRKFNIHYNRTVITVTLLEYEHKFIIARLIIPIMRNFSYKIEGKIKTHILCQRNFLFQKVFPFFETMWKNIVEPDRPQVSI